jgi:hypothetical protein
MAISSAQNGQPIVTTVHCPPPHSTGVTTPSPRRMPQRRRWRWAGMLAAVCIGTLPSTVLAFPTPSATAVALGTEGIQTPQAQLPRPAPESAPVPPAAPPPADIAILVDMVTQWLGALALLVGAGAATAGIYQYRRHCQWRRLETVREVVAEFCANPAVQHAIDILDYEEYRLFDIPLPNGDVASVEATDVRLQRALRSHDEMVKTRRGLDELAARVAQEGSAVDDKIARIVERYRTEEFPIELTLRGWFDEFLMGLEHFNSMIEAGNANAEAFKPFIVYWVRLISDRRFRRKGGSGFYDQLSHYIHWAGFDGVQRLFERYGYKILPPPYSTHDFSDFEMEPGPYDAYRALCLAKAAHLVYEDMDYVKDIVSYWLSADQDDHLWQRMSPREYVVDLMKHWLREGDPQDHSLLDDNFRYFNEPSTDTQGILFRKGRHIVLAFRGSQQIQDWRTNFSVSRRLFKTTLEPTPDLWPQGSVHRGFQGAWESVERRVVFYLRQWWGEDCCLWVTGHSLGGALANLAGVALDYQGFKVSGLYTFGQPRVGDWQFVREVNQVMGDRIFRYANNNDVVPLIPPPFIPWNPTRLYGHMGAFRYFNTFGKLHMTSWPSQRWFDHLLGLVLALREAGTDLVADHMMEFYVNRLQAALNREIEAEKAEEKKAQWELELKAKTMNP